MGEGGDMSREDREREGKRNGEGTRNDLFRSFRSSSPFPPPSLRSRVPPDGGAY